MLEVGLAVGYIQIFSDTVVDDPYGRPYKCRVVQCAAARALASTTKFEARGAGELSGLRVRHGCHPMTVAAMLEAGGPKGLREAGAH